MNRLAGPIPSGIDCGLSVSDLLTSLRQRFRLAPLVREAFVEQAVLQAARDAQLHTSDAELQHAANRFRLRHGLSSAVATRRWLADKQVSPTDWEEALERDLLIEKFKDYLVTTRSEEYFATHAERYARVRLRRAIVTTEGLARELLAQVVEEGLPFEDVAARADNPAAGDLGEVFRGQLPDDVGNAVFAAKSGDIVGPLSSPHGFALYQVSDIRTPALDASTLEAVRNDVFAAWLRNRMAGVTVRLTGLNSQ